MSYPHMKLSVDKPERYYYANHDIESDWKIHRTMIKNSIKIEINKFVKEFETVKTYKNVDLIETAKIFCIAYEKFRELPYLNSFLKCIDMLCSIKKDLNIEDEIKLYTFIEKEKHFISKLEENL